MGPFRRLGIVVAVSLPSAWLLYVLLVNGLMLSGGLEALVYAPNSVRLSFASAWTLWPGVVHAKGIRIVIQDHNIECSIDISHADATVRLRDLTSRVFHATKVRGSGVVFRFRNRVQPASAHLASVAALPPIPGMANPPIYDAWAPPPPLTDKNYDLWSVELDDVDVLVAELWIEQFRYLGSARAVGAFRLVPARRLWVGPASLELDPGKVLVGAEETLSGFSGRITCLVPEFDVRIPTGLQVTRYVSAGVRLSGNVVSPHFIALFLPSAESLRIELHGGRLAADGTFDRGTFASSSSLLFSGDDLDVARSEAAVRLKGPFELKVMKAETAGAARAELETTSVYARSSSVHVAARAKLEVNRGPCAPNTASCAYRADLAVSSLDVESGAGTSEGWLAAMPTASVVASLDGAEDSLSGNVTVTANQARVHGPRWSTQGDVLARLRLRAADLAVPSAKLDGTVDLTNGSAVTETRRTSGWWAKLKIQAARVESSSEMDVRLYANVRDGLPALMVLQSEHDIPGWLTGALPQEELGATFDVSRRCGLTDVKIAHAGGNLLEARGRIQRESGETGGAMLVLLRPAKILSAGLTVSPTGTHWSPFAGSDWLDGKLAELELHSAAACGSREFPKVPADTLPAQ